MSLEHARELSRYSAVPTLDHSRYLLVATLLVRGLLRLLLAATVIEVLS